MNRGEKTMRKWRLIYDRIDAITVTRETASTVWFTTVGDKYNVEQREKKGGRYSGLIFDSYEEAKRDFERSLKTRITQHEGNIKALRHKLSSLQSRPDTVTGE